MNTASVTRAFARNAAESAYPNLWRGLVAAWLPPGAPKHPTRLIDYSGNGNHGTLQNGASWDIGKGGRCVSFDGVDDDVIGDTPGKNFPSGGESRTVSCWIKSSGWTGDTGLLHWGKIGPTPPSCNYHLVASRDGKIWWGNGYDNGLVYGNKSISDGNWHHVVGTYESGKAIIYIDGVVDAIDYHTAATLLDDSWRCGRFQNQLGAWPGRLSSCYVYKRALSSAEIKFLYANQGPLTRRKTRLLSSRKNKAHTFFSVSG